MPLSGTRGLIPRLRLNPLALGPTGVGLMIGQMVVEEMFDRYMLWMSGLQFVRSCSPNIISGWSYTQNDVCLVGTGSVVASMSQLVTQRPLATAGWYHILGPAILNIITGQRRRSDVAVYKADSTLYDGRRTHPWIQQIPRSNYAPATSIGSRPGFVPSNVRPWPVWTRPRPWVQPQPRPDVDDTDVGPRPWRWEWTGPRGRATGRSTARTVARAVPDTGTREVKIGANTHAATLFFQLIRARELVSEIEDFWEVLYASLPRTTRQAYGGNDVSNAQMLTALWENWDRIDPVAFLENLVANQIEDEIIGRTWINYRSQLRNLVHGNRMGSLGPVANDSFKEYAKAVSDLAKHVASGLRDEAQRAGWEDKYRDLLKRSDTAFQRLLRAAANQRR